MVLVGLLDRKVMVDMQLVFEKIMFLFYFNFSIVMDEPPLKMSKYIYLDKSDIPNAGMGVRAAKFIPKGTILGKYNGRRLTRREYLKLRNKDYVFEVSGYPRIYIDASNIKYSNWTRYINGARTKRQKKLINIETFEKHKNIYFEAIVDIEPDEELIFDYGRHYW